MVFFFAFSSNLNFPHLRLHLQAYLYIGLRPANHHLSAIIGMPCLKVVVESAAQQHKTNTAYGRAQ